MPNQPLTNINWHEYNAVLDEGKDLYLSQYLAKFRLERELSLALFPMQFEATLSIIKRSPTNIKEAQGDYIYIPEVKFFIASLTVVPEEELKISIKVPVPYYVQEFESFYGAKVACSTALEDWCARRQMLIIPLNTSTG